jgi:hypothetical protein
MRVSSTGGFLPDLHWRYWHGRWLSMTVIGYFALAALPAFLVSAFTPLWSSPAEGLSYLPLVALAAAVYLALGKLGTSYWDGRLRQELGLWLQATYGVKFTDQEVRLLYLGEGVVRDGRYWAVHLNEQRGEGFKLDSEPEDDGADETT